MENKKKYIIIFSIILALLAIVSVATATEVNAASVPKQNLSDYAGLELKESQKYQYQADSMIKNIEGTEKEINNTRKKISDYDKQIVNKNKQLTTKNKQLTTKNKQLKTYNNKLKKLNKKRKTKVVKNNILKTKKTIKTIKKQITTYKKNIATTKKEITALNKNKTTNKQIEQNFIQINSSQTKVAENTMKKAWQHLDYSVWALDILNNYNLYVAISFNNDQKEIPYNDKFDYGYWWEYPEAKHDYYYTYPPTFNSFLLGNY